MLSVRHISKAFPGVQALSDMQLDVHAGEIHALVGENGAGKSTLTKIIAGAQAPDAGEMSLDGKPVRWTGPAAAKAAGDPRHLPGIRAVPASVGGREHLHRALPPQPPARGRSRRHRAGGGRAHGAPRRAAGAVAPVGRADRGRPADGGNRQGPGRPAQASDPGRADGGDRRPGGGRRWSRRLAASGAARTTVAIAVAPFPVGGALQACVRIALQPHRVHQDRPAAAGDLGPVIQGKPPGGLPGTATGRVTRLSARSSVAVSCMSTRRRRDKAAPSNRIVSWGSHSSRGPGLEPQVGRDAGRLVRMPRPVAALRRLARNQHRAAGATGDRAGQIVTRRDAARDIDQHRFQRVRRRTAREQQLEAALLPEGRSCARRRPGRRPAGAGRPRDRCSAGSIAGAGMNE